MRDDDEITGVHGLPLPVQVVIVSLHDKHKALVRDVGKLGEDVEEMDDKLNELTSDAAAIKKTANLIKWLIVLLGAIIGLVGGGHLAMMHH